MALRGMIPIIIPFFFLAQPFHSHFHSLHTCYIQFQHWDSFSYNKNECTCTFDALKCVHCAHIVCRCFGENGWAGSDQLPVDHRDHSPVPSHHGVWQRALQNGTNRINPSEFQNFFLLVSPWMDEKSVTTSFILFCSCVLGCNLHPAEDSPGRHRAGIYLSNLWALLPRCYDSCESHS